MVHPGIIINCHCTEYDSNTEEIIKKGCDNFCRSKKISRPRPKIDTRGRGLQKTNTFCRELASLTKMISSLILIPKTLITFSVRLYSRASLVGSATAVLQNNKSNDFVPTEFNWKQESSFQIVNYLKLSYLHYFDCSMWGVDVIMQSDLPYFMIRISIINKNYTGITRIFNPIVMDQWMRSVKKAYTTPIVTSKEITLTWLGKR